MRKFSLFHVTTMLGLTWVLFSACQKDAVLENPVSNSLELDFPSYFPQPHYQFITNVLSKDRVTLGRELFYDPILSIDSTISCASCHMQTAAFSDAGRTLSIGVNGAKGTRNSPAIFNMLWNTSFMWDGGINHLEIMPLAPLTVENEMGEEMNHLLAKLKSNPKYVQLFKNAFGETGINATNFFYSLAQFMGSLIAADSKYDDFRKGKRVLSEDEQKGYQLFLAHCNQCHKEPLFTDYSFHNNGIDTQFTDIGRGRITLENLDEGKFKVPSLRNVSLTAPYMHNGQMNTLSEVIDHYSEGIKQSGTLAVSLQGGFHFSKEEKQQLLLFLHTLTDRNLVLNSEFSAPSK